MTPSDLPLGVYSVYGLAQQLKRDRATINRLITEKGVVPVRETKKGKYYHLSDVVNSMLDSEDLNLAQEQAKLNKERRKKVKIEREVLEGNLVPAEDVVKAWQKVISAMRTRLLSIPTKAAPLVIASETQIEAKDILKSQVNDALAELYRDMPESDS